jgi:hypothetical protein
MLPGSLFDFKDKEGVLDAVRAQTAGNGVDFDTRGVFAVVALRPDFGDKARQMGQNLVVEFATNVIEALVLALLLRSAPPASWRATPSARSPGWPRFWGRRCRTGTSTDSPCR